MKFLTTHSTSRTGYYLCLFMQTQFQLGNTNLLAKVGIKSCRFATECVSFVHVWMQLANQLELCLHEQTQIVASAACRVGSQEFHNWIASLPLVSLLFIVIPTPFLNF